MPRATLLSISLCAALCLGACRRKPLNSHRDAGPDATSTDVAGRETSADERVDDAAAPDGGTPDAPSSDASSDDGRDAADAPAPVDGMLVLTPTPYPNPAPLPAWPADLPIQKAPATPVSMGPPVCYAGGWCWSTPLPMGGPLAVWAGAADDVWVVGLQGSARHFDGQTWKNVPTPTTADLTNVWGLGPNAVWATSDAGLLRWDGAQWRQASPSDRNGDRIAGRAANDLWIGSSTTDGLWHFDGAAWKNVGAFGTTDLFATADGALYASLASEDAELLSIQPGSAPQTFDADDTYTPAGVWAASRADVWVAYPKALRRFDGTSWRSALTLFQDETPFLTGVRGAGAGQVWLSAWDGTMLRSNGTTTERWDADLTSALHISVRAPNDVWASGNGGGLSHFDGTSWQRRGTGPKLQWVNQLLDVGQDEVWALGSTGKQPRILRHPSGGEWQEVPSAFPETSFVGGWASAPDDVWLVGDDNSPTAKPVLAHWDGAAWSRAELPRGRRYLGIWGAGRGDVWLGGDAGLLHLEGTTFVPVPPPLGVTARGWGGLTGSGKDDVWTTAWVKGQEYRLYHWDGARWTEHMPAATPSITWVGARGPNDVFAANGAELFHYDGAAWTRIAESEERSLGYTLRLGGGELWNGLSEGVTRWDGGKWTTPDPLPHGCSVVLPMAKDVWIGCRDGTSGGILRHPR